MPAKSKGLKIVIKWLVELWNNDWYRLFEVWWLMTEVNTSVCYINNTSSTLGIA